MAEQEETQVEETATTDASTDEAVVEGEAGTFEPAEFERTFGMPEGSLKDVKDADEALQRIRDFTDKSLLAGSGEDETPAPPKTETKSETKTETKNENAEYAAIRKELDEVKTTLANREKSDNERTVADYKRRLDAEIDSWQSPKYGLSGKRNYKQKEEYTALMRLASVHGAGYKNSKMEMPPIEAVVRGARAYRDDDFTLSTAAKIAQQETKTVPVGTPGAGGKKASAPANIHEALMRQPR